LVIKQLTTGAAGDGLRWCVVWPFLVLPGWWTVSEVDVGWYEIVDALVVAVVVVVVDEGLDLGFEIAGQKVVSPAGCGSSGSGARARSCPGSSDDRGRRECARCSGCPAMWPGLRRHSWSRCRAAAPVAVAARPQQASRPAAPGRAWRSHPEPSLWCIVSRRRCSGRSRRARSTGRTTPRRSP
jgi:hypothetical protein